MEAFTLANHLRAVVGPSVHFLGQLEQFRASLRIGCDKDTVVKSNITGDHYVEDMIARRWHDFQLSSLSPPEPILRSEICHVEPISISILPQVHSLV